MDLKTIGVVLWSVLIAVPGFVAFFWQWQDRQEKRKGPLLVASIRKAKFVEEYNGWSPIRVLFRNDRKDVITVHEISIIDSADKLMLTKATRSSTNNSARPIEKSAFAKLMVRWIVRPVLLEQRSEKFSSETLLFVGSTVCNKLADQISIRFRYSTASNSRRIITIDTVSEPIDINKISMDTIDHAT